MTSPTVIHQMCGITGFNWNDKQLIESMTSTLVHRGPDQYGYFTDKHISLGHRRLSIIDLSEKGRQPMCDANKEIYVVFNGEIYNFNELRHELEKKYTFKSNSDTETIIYAYKEWGTECFNSFNGMWAICIYDVKKRRMILSRDRLGKKPLYYYWDGKKFIFASEIKAILKHNLKLSINKDAIDFYLALNYIPAPWSIYKNIYKVEARQYIDFNLIRNSFKKEYYYNIPQYYPLYDKERLINEGKELLKDATKIRLVADVPVGAFLSGGLDSSAVVANMAELIDIKYLNTFSIGFEKKYDESKYIHIVEEFFGTKHHHKYFTEQDFKDLLDILPTYYDEPFADYSSFPTYDVSRLARKDVMVCLGGDGGDEIFGGYKDHQIAAQFHMLYKVPKLIRKASYHLMPINESNSFLGRIKEALRLSLHPKESFYAELGSTFIYKPDVFKKWSKEKMDICLKHSGNDFREAVLKYHLFFNTLSDNFLVKVDRASMANSLEVRAPFLDYRFIEFSNRIPSKWKANSSTTKILMRDIIKGMVPEDIRKRGKQGFAPPIKEWITKPEYMEETKRYLDELYNKKIISQEWHDFYNDVVFKNNQRVYINYIIKMFMLGRWFKSQ
jgi:asparagine synthase (glutamine-hydrolysing)